MAYFKPVQGYEGLYSISSEGVVYTHARWRVKPGPLKQGVTKRGYPIVSLFKNGKGTSYYVHPCCQALFNHSRKGAGQPH